VPLNIRARQAKPVAVQVIRQLAREFFGVPSSDFSDPAGAPQLTTCSNFQFCADRIQLRLRLALGLPLMLFSDSLSNAPRIVPETRPSLGERNEELIFSVSNINFSSVPEVGKVSDDNLDPVTNIQCSEAVLTLIHGESPTGVKNRSRLLWLGPGISKISGNIILPTIVLNTRSNLGSLVAVWRSVQASPLGDRSIPDVIQGLSQQFWKQASEAGSQFSSDYTASLPFEGTAMERSCTSIQLFVPSIALSFSKSVR
jgi:hypothetical protein